MAQAYLQAYRKSAGGSLEYMELPIGLASNPGTPGVYSQISSNEESGSVRRTTLTLTAYPLAIVDHTVNGSHGTIQLYTFPNGLTQIFGAKMNLTITGDGTSIAANAAFVSAVGTAVGAITNATLTGTEANIIPSTAMTLVTSTKTATGITATAPGLFDGSSTEKIAYLNFAVVDAGTSADGVLTVSGTVTIAWMVT